MKSIGADQGQVVLLFLSELALLGLVGGVASFFGGSLLYRWIGAVVFQHPVKAQPVLLPITVGLGLGIALLGGVFPLGRFLRADPVVSLKGA